MSDIIVNIIQPPAPVINVTPSAPPLINVVPVVAPIINITPAIAPIINITPVVAPIINVGAMNGGASEIQHIAGEALVSHIPIALVGGLAYKMNYLNPLHQFAFIGFSKTSATVNALVGIEDKVITLPGWGLLPNQTYMVGEAGGLITTNSTPNSFTKIVGFSQSATSMLIVKGYTSINKN